uniref:hypothetical protein n=1 Tax=Anaerobiospirillum succiniciproducens TaxID=13335 RepID=UPI0029434B49
MKQTNNAIKFLMAQYRAIFKNANIAMLAAIAASALAAGQAQAAHDDWTKLSGEKVTVNNTDTLTLSKKGPQVNENAFNLVLVSGAAATLKGDNTSADPNKGPGDYQAVNATITLDGTEGGGSTAEHATLAIGDSTNGNLVANVKVGSVVNKVGKITVTGSGAQATSSLSAGSITIGDDNNSGADLAQVVVEAHGKLNVTGETGLAIKKGAKIDVKANGSLTATNVVMTSGSVTNSGAFSSDYLTISDGSITNDGTAFTVGTLNLSGGTLTATKAVTASNELNITGGKVDATKAVSGKTIKVTGGEVDFAAETGVLGSDTTDLITISGGTVGATTAAGTIKGKTIKFENGDIKATNALTIEGGFEATGGTITVEDNQTVTFKGNASIADDVTVTLNGTTKHTIKVVGTDDENNGKLSVSAKKFGELTGGKGTNTISLSGAAAQAIAELHFTDPSIDLGSTAKTGLGLLTDSVGQLGTKVTIDGSNAGVAKISGIGGTFDKADALDSQNKKLALDFQTLTLGKNAFEVKGGATVVARKTLTIGDGSKDLTGNVDLEGADGSSGNSVAAGKITVGGSDSGSLAVKAGNWEVSALDLKNGKTDIESGAGLTVNGKLSAATGTTVTVKKGGSLSTVGSGSLGFKEADNNALTVNGKLELDEGDL